MKISQAMKGGTVGALATFIAHALNNGVPLDAPIAMARNRGSDITELTIEMNLPGFDGAPAAADELARAIAGTQRAPRTRRTPAPAETPAAETPAAE